MLQNFIFNIKKERTFNLLYPIFEKWWRDWGFDPILPEMLSDNGIIISKNNIPICAGWLFRTDSNTAIAGWLISCKGYKKEREGCIEELIKQLQILAKKLGFEILNFPASNPNLRNKLEKNGFGDFADKNITNYFKRI